MFAKLFCMFMAVLLLALGGVGLTSYANSGIRQIDARLEELKKQAREISLSGQPEYRLRRKLLFRLRYHHAGLPELEGCRGV